jgi:transcriptional regulator GlxA family with amidase domain
LSCLRARASVISGNLISHRGPSEGRAELRALGTNHTALLVSCMDLIESLRRASASEVVASVVQHRLRELLAPAAAGLFSHSQALPVGPEDKVMRRIAVVRACTHIDEHLREPIKLGDLCRVADVRARTLESGFQEFYDIGPMAYLRSVRLCRARRDLLNARRLDASVEKIARQWTFSHMGQFSRDYRVLFGENPSTTLERARPSAARSTHAPGPPSG